MFFSYRPLLCHFLCQAPNGGKRRTRSNQTMETWHRQQPANLSSGLGCGTLNQSQDDHFGSSGVTGNRRADGSESAVDVDRVGQRGHRHDFHDLYNGAERMGQAAAQWRISFVWIARLFLHICFSCFCCRFISPLSAIALGLQAV